MHGIFFLFLIKRKDTISFMVKSLENLIILRHILTREKKKIPFSIIIIIIIIIIVIIIRHINVTFIFYFF